MVSDTMRYTRSVESDAVPTRGDASSTLLVNAVGQRCCWSTLLLVSAVARSAVAWRAVAREIVGSVHAAFGQPQQAHDNQHRPADEQHLVPAALVGDDGEGRIGREHCGHVYRSYGLG